MTRQTVVGCTLLVVATLAVAAGRVMLAQGADSHVGAWKMNAAKSKFTPGPGPKDMTLVYAAAPSGRMSLSVKGTDPQGKPITTSQNIIMDEKDHPATGNPNWDTEAWKRIDS